VSWKQIKTREAPLSGVRVLVVEDEPIIALELEAALVECGADVVGPTSDLEESLELARQPKIAAALLDVRLGRASVGPLARALHDIGVPFAFYTGQTEFDFVRREWPEAPVVQKPSPTRDVINVVRLLCHLGAEGLPPGGRV
jgi:DNA-binding NarL/FixJ family response regulator